MASVNEPTRQQWVQSLFEPAVLLGWAMSYYTGVCFETVFKRGQVLAPLLESSKLRDEAFGRFWIQFTANRAAAQADQEPRNDESTTTTTTASPPPQIQGSADLIPPILATASGVILDIGPGTGSQLPFLHSPAIKAIFGPEPCLGLHDELQSRIRAEGLQDKYTVLPCGVDAKELIPALQKQGAVPSDVASVADVQRHGGVFDTIVCVRVLCSVPDLERSAKELYVLLRPGGKLLVTEHVVNPWRRAKGSVVARFMQALYQMAGWSWFIGNCRLNRDTEKALRKAAEVDGGWDAVEVDRWFERTPMPYLAGKFVKKNLC